MLQPVYKGAHRLCSSLYIQTRLTRRLLADDVMSRAILLCYMSRAEGSLYVQDNCSKVAHPLCGPGREVGQD